ncbi:MAG: threonine synthase [Bacteroidota bacterium]
MKYFSTNSLSEQADFKTATILGQASDKGLYFPENIPQIEPDFFKNLSQYTKEEIALKVIEPYVGNTIPKNILEAIVTETIAFPIPLVQVNNNIFSLELFHGPTLAFKDVGARFMSRCLGYFLQNNKQKVTVLVATSGDTGGAVANGFYNVDGIDVVILYPSKKVSEVQEQQLTTLGKNITALEVEGSFDDCQQMVKEAFADKEITEKMFLTSANSINVARWLPQQFYYFFALQQWTENEPPVISVPSGNFGNICAGLLAERSGLPVVHFIAACNANNSVTEYLENGLYHTKKSVATLSNAMDVGNPSNFTRVLQLFQQNYGLLKNTLSSYSISDEETKQTIAEVYQNNNYLTDPHGAVGYAALKKYLQQHPNQQGIFLETAHPVKFCDVVEPVIGKKIELPASVALLALKEKRSIKIKSRYSELKEFLLSV